MARVLRFYTAAFDVTKERPNPVNPIPGESLLLWLIERAKDAVEISAPASEDWGWYSYAEGPEISAWRKRRRPRRGWAARMDSTDRQTQVREGEAARPSKDESG